jgi:myosin-5
LNLQGDWRDGYWRTIALVLQLSNVKYDDSGFNGSNACEISSQALLDDIATIMKVEKKALLDALTTKTSIVMGQEIVIYFDKAGCQGLCEAFSKDIYNKLFSWVIKYLNLALLPEAEKLSGKDPAKIYQKIGLLDIFGFEIFENNSIEQLCINFTNEKLHQLYVEYVFKLEVQTFIDEGLKQFLANLSFNDNQEVLDILAHPDRNKYSVFNLIDDQAATMSKDMNLIDQFNQFHGKNPKMGFNKTKRNIFMIVHTARAVGYTIDGFCEKNKDEVPRPIMRCVLSSKCQRFVDIYCQKIKDGDAAVDYLGETVKKKESFIGYKFRQQMDALMTELRSCQCHFMRCIKPNEQKSATVWTSSLVVLQIRYLGLLDSIKIRKESYPYRFNFVKFVHRYLELEPTYSALTPQELDAKNPDYVNLSNNILKKGIPEHGPKTCLVGKTRVFLKIEAYQRLEAVYEEVVKVKKDAIKALDKILLEVKLKSRIIDFRRKGVVAVELVKQLVFGFKSKQNAMRFKMIRKVAYKLQANYRLQKGLRLFRKKRQSVCTIQSAMEAFIAQKKAKDKVVSAKVIARYYKNYRWCSSLKFYIEILRKVRAIAFESVVESIKRKQEKAAIIIQKNFKGIRCRKENAAEVKKIKIARELFKYNKAMVILKKYLAGRVTRTRIKRVMNAAEKIQAYFKMRWTSEAYQRTREKAIFIQRFVKEWLKRKLVKDRKRMEYLKNEYIPFLKKCYSDQSRLYEIDCGPTKKELSKEVAFEEPKTHQVYQQIPKVDTSSVHKIRFYVDVIDLDYMHDILNSYQGSWSKGYIDAHKDAKKIKTDVRVVEIGSHHTVMATSNGRCYCWGRNDELQLGTDKTEETMAVFRVLKGEERLRQIATGNEHTHVLTKDRTVFSYGRNDKGQLGLGSNKPLDKIELNTSLTKCKLKSIHAKRDSSYAVTEEGEVMFWPISNSNPGIGVLNVGNKETINSIALGDDFAVLLAENGSVYSFGRKNEFGQLGLGHNKPCLVPTILSSLQKERISNISAGRAHVSCLTKNNKIFAWGEGSKGQLGVSALNNYLTPAPVKSFCQTKTVQVCCGIHSTYALQEDGAVYWWGRNSRVRLVQKPSLFRSLEDPELFPVQIRTSWSENLNCAYLIIADLRYVTDLNIAQKHTYAKIMAAKWNSMGNSQCTFL